MTDQDIPFLGKLRIEFRNAAVADARAPASRWRSTGAPMAGVASRNGLASHRRARLLFDRRSRTNRRLALLIVLVVAGCATAVAAVIDNYWLALPHDTATKLFAANPSLCYRNACSANSVSVVRHSVKHVQTLDIPGVGHVQYWVATTTRGDFCSAFRLPDGIWAGTELDRQYNFSGAVPGCDALSTLEGGGGIRFTTNQFSGYRMRDGHLMVSGRIQTVAYGILTMHSQAAEVRDITTGAHTRVFDGRYFALVIPARFVLARNTLGGTSLGRSAKIWHAGPIRLEALDAAGDVIARAGVRP